MTLDSLAPYLIPALATIAVAVIGLRPKRSSPEQIMSDELKRMSERISNLEGSNASLWSTVQELRGKVDSLYARLQRLKGYVRELESHILCKTGEPYQRPEEIEELFEDTH